MSRRVEGASWYPYSCSRVERRDERSKCDALAKERKKYGLRRRVRIKVAEQVPGGIPIIL